MVMDQPGIFDPNTAFTDEQKERIINLTYAITYHQKCSYKAFQAYKINSYEMEMLMGFYASLSLTRAKTTSKRFVLDLKTGNTKRHAKLLGAFYGLRDKGAIKKVLYNGKDAYHLTEIAEKSLDMYFTEMERLIARDKVRYARKRMKVDSKKVVDFRSFTIHDIKDLIKPNYKEAA